jgi:cell division protein FtsB
MNADRQPRKKVRRQPRHRHKPYRGIVAEMSLKLILSWIIAIGAIASVSKLLPYHLSQQSKLKELKFQVQETNARVDKLRDELNHNFDPQQTQNLMEQYSSLTSPNQSRIYWLPEDSQQ